MSLAMIMPGPTEWMWIAGICVVLFGAKKLPELARGVGQSVVELKRGLRDPLELEEGDQE